MGLGLVTFPSIKIVLSRDFYFSPIGIFSFGMPCPAASPDGGKGAVANPLWDEERDGSDYAGGTTEQLLGCRHARFWAPWCCWAGPAATGHSDTPVDGQAGHSAAGHLVCSPSDPMPVCPTPAARLVFLEAQYFSWLPWVILYSSFFQKKKKLKKKEKMTETKVLENFPRCCSCFS